MIISFSSAKVGEKLYLRCVSGISQTGKRWDLTEGEIYVGTYTIVGLQPAYIIDGSTYKYDRFERLSLSEIRKYKLININKNTAL